MRNYRQDLHREIESYIDVGAITRKRNKEGDYEVHMEKMLTSDLAVLADLCHSVFGGDDQWLFLTETSAGLNVLSSMKHIAAQAGYDVIDSDIGKAICDAMVEHYRDRIAEEAETVFEEMAAEQGFINDAIRRQQDHTLGDYYA